MSAKNLKLLEKGIKAFQIGDLNSATLFLSRVLQQDKTNLVALAILGVINAIQKNFQESVIYFKKAIEISPNDASLYFNLAKVLMDSGAYVESIQYFRHVIGVAPNNLAAWLNYGISELKSNNFKKALELFQHTINMQPTYAEAFINKGLALYELGSYVDALISTKQALALDPNLEVGWLNLGVIYCRFGQYEDAINSYGEALKLKPNYSEAIFNKGNVLNKLKRFDSAIECFEKAISLKPDYAEPWSNKGLSLHELKRFDSAIECFEKAISLKPDYAEPWSNKGLSLHELKRFDSAIECFEKAISLKPDYAEPWSNKGLSLHELKRFDSAIECFEKAISLKPDYAEPWSNKGLSLHELKRFDSAIECFEKAISLKPDLEWAFGYLMHTKMQICNWDKFDENLESLISRVVKNEKAIQPFQFLSLVDDPMAHKQATITYLHSRNIFSTDSYKFSSNSLENKKIRIGYFSPDFKNHAISLLIAEMIELHNREKFEVYGFSLTSGSQDDPTRNRIKNAFDEFLEVEKNTDDEVVKISREIGIDIAIDLSGYTQNSRPQIFAKRVAPIQVNYLGYLGTMGAKFMDYIIADKEIIVDQKYYSEKVIYLPNSFQANDRKKLFPNKIFSREDFNLSQDNFVYCCFNQNFKITPFIFDAWLRILKEVKQGILFLYAESLETQKNLKKQASSKGVNPERLIFGNRLTLELYLARYEVCDLFLDTFPYNAGTTASDALWMGLPVLTIKGKSFASRYGASLLSSIYLQDLVVDNIDSYVEMAIDLAQDPRKIQDIKFKLKKSRLNAPLFDTPLFISNIEQAYTAICKRNLMGLGPEHLNID